MEHFNWSISLGDVVNLGAVLGGIAIAYHKIVLRISLLELRFNLLARKSAPELVDLNHG